ncbi:P1 family peptidase [Leucobacter chromiireducens]|uniref:S58 family peptidase n=1 Tax=Leucobacter chromiireducens subsp. chromiireducens TaxID=660067 RepID=A0ABS1SNK2_9MICO|nr:P1 family peptidase [Leucobacter chromiireducens]MBL3689760.1 S58 family peptidase [Leucobacter chromiireducens subsp. chromiireducens]
MSMESRPRAAELGIPAGQFARGVENAITDVPGIRVGHSTVQTERLSTGVTAIVPDALGPDRKSIPAGLSVGNGYGKLVGVSQLCELGSIETPVLLTSTLSAFRVADALVAYMLEQPGHETTTTLNPVVGETNDGFLSDIRSRPVGEAEVRAALAAADTGPVAEGGVGAGTGTVALGYKGGIGTASRIVGVGATEYTVGAIVQSNYTGTLQLAGVPIPAAEVLPGEPAETIGNSCMIVVATDAPLDARQLRRLANRAVFALRGTGSDFAQGSGDYAISVSVGTGAPPSDDDLSPAFLATMEAVEEALVNSVLRAETRVGFEGRTAHAVPIAEVRRRLARAGIGADSLLSR